MTHDWRKALDSEFQSILSQAFEAGWHECSHAHGLEPRTAPIRVREDDGTLSLLLDGKRWVEAPKP